MNVYAQTYALENAYKIEQRDMYIKELDEMAQQGGVLGQVPTSIDSRGLISFSTYRYWLGPEFGVTTWRKESQSSSNYLVEMKDPIKAKSSCDQHNEAGKKLDELVADCTQDLAGVKHLYSKMALNYGYDTVGTSPYDLLVNGSGSCHAFAKAFASALDKLGIESYYVLGYTSAGGFHAWNSFIVDGKVYTADVSEAALNKGNLGESSIWNYMLEDSSMTLGDGRTIERIY